MKKTIDIDITDSNGRTQKVIIFTSHITSIWQNATVADIMLSCGTKIPTKQSTTQIYTSLRD
jgi:hypothetical protein